MKKLTQITLILISFFYISTGFSNTDSTIKKAKINKLLNNYNSYSKFMGSILVAQNGKELFKKGYGMANVEWDIPNDSDTKFRIASITKQFTAMLIIQLVSEGKLDLNVPISTYLPDYPKKNADVITIHHLLTHTSGIPEFDDFVNYRDIERDRFKPKELLEIFAKGQLQFTPGEKYAYSNPGYVVLGIIIEKITGKSYATALQDRIFTPLNMFNSGYDVNYEIIKKRASGYTNNYLRGQYINVNYTDMSIPYAAGSIYSTVEDLFKWDQALYTEQLVPKKYRDLLFGKHIPTRNRHYGYGWFMRGLPIGKSDEQVQVMVHGGGINGFRTLITRIPTTKSTIIILSNLETTSVYEITQAIIGILNDKPYNEKNSIAYSLVEVVSNDGIEKGLDHYKNIKNADGFYMDLNEMNIAGYELIDENKLQQAAFIFKLNVEAYPNSFIPYDSYGDILMKLGYEEQSIKNYRKSLALNPNNKNAEKIIKEYNIKQKSNSILKFQSGINSIFQDNQGNYWFGSHNEGVALFDGKIFTYFTVDDGLSHNQVRTIQEHKDGSIWFGTGNGVSSYNGKKIINNSSNDHIIGFESKTLNMPYIVNNFSQNLWFNADNKPGFYKLEDQKLSFIKFPVKVDSKRFNEFAVSGRIKSQNGYVWIPTYTAVIGYDGTRFQIIDDKFIEMTNSKNELHVRSLLEDSKGNLWIGNNGIGVLLKSGDKIINFSDKQGLIHEKSEGRGSHSPQGTLEHVFAIEEDNQGNIWFGDRDTGVWKYDGVSMTNFSMDDGLSSNFVQTMFVDNTGGQWLGLADGSVYLFNGKSFDRKFFK